MRTYSRQLSSSASIFPLQLINEEEDKEEEDAQKYKSEEEVTMIWMLTTTKDVTFLV